MASGGCRLLLFSSAGLRRWSAWTDGAFFLPRLSAWVSRPWLRFLGNDPKNNAPLGSGSGAVFSSFFNYIAHFSQKSKPYGTAKGRFQSFPYYIFVTAG